MSGLAIGFHKYTFPCLLHPVVTSSAGEIFAEKDLLAENLN
jgi:hypothetical protein